MFKRQGAQALGIDQLRQAREMVPEAKQGQMLQDAINRANLSASQVEKVFSQAAQIAKSLGLK